MPLTFSHPLAVVPIYRLWPTQFNFAALVVGSMSPDFAYYIRQFPIASYAHTVIGSFAICLPTGLMALAIFYWVRKPLCFVLPQPHRGALMPLARKQPRISLRNILVAAVSVLIGAWTHNIWDSFTHAGGWTARHLPFLRTPLLHIGDTDLPASYFLQQLSTLGAAGALGLLYFLWLRRQPCPPPPIHETLSDTWRYLIVGVLIFIALALALPPAFGAASFYDGYTAVRVFLFRTAVYSVATFTPLLVLVSVLLYRYDQKKPNHSVQ